MAITSGNDCQSICAEVRSRLAKLELMHAAEARHAPVWAGLNQIVFVKRDDLNKLLATSENVEAIHELRERYKDA